MANQVLRVHEITVERMQELKESVEYFEIVLATDLGELRFGLPQQKAEQLAQRIQTALSGVQEENN